MKTAQLEGRHQACVWKYHCTQLDNTTTNQKNSRGDVSRAPYAKLPVELTNKLDSCRIRSTKKQRFGPPLSDIPMWLVNVWNQGNRGVSILLVPRVTRWANSNCALARTLNFRGSTQYLCTWNSLHILSPWARHQGFLQPFLRHYVNPAWRARSSVSAR